MTEHVTAWLGAYHDGELQGRRWRQVEAHLAHCATCRAGLERLRALAALLQESPAAGDLMPPERFVAQVGLRLPRRPERPAWQRGLEIGWQVVPLGLFGACSSWLGWCWSHCEWAWEATW
jgi:anti-sigma factor RsiW